MPLGKIARRAVLVTSLVLSVSAPLHAAVSVDVALGDVSINKVPFLIAADAGIYSRNGLEVHQFITPGAAEAAKKSGVMVPPEYVKADAKAPVSIGGGSPMMMGATRKPGPVPRVIVSTTEDIARDHVIALPTVKSFADLKGKRIGYSGNGTVTHFDALSFVKKMGWDPQKDVTLVGDSATLEALKQGKVDAIMGSAMIVAMAEQNHFKDLGDLSAFNIPMPGSSIIVDKAWLGDHRDAVARFVKSAVQAVALMKTDKKVFDAALAKWFNIKDKQTQDSMFAAVSHFPEKPYPAVAGIKGFLELYDGPVVRSHKAEEFYDSSFVAELDRSGVLAHPLDRK